jgi:hypothetical protein
MSAMPTRPSARCGQERLLRFEPPRSWVSPGGSGIGALPPPTGQAETFLERPVFGVKRPFSNAWGIRGARGGQISIQRRRRDAEPVCDLSHADAGLASIALAASMSSSVSFGGRPPVRPARRAAARPAWGALADQAALEFRQCTKHMKDKPPFAPISPGRWCATHAARVTRRMVRAESGIAPFMVFRSLLSP